MSAIIDNAASATARSDRFIESAQNLLKRDRPRNLFGVYIDRHAVIIDLMAARRDLDAAFDALNANWPTPADYKQV